MIFSALVFLEAAAIYTTLLAPAFFFAGVGPAPEFALRSLAAACFSLVLTRMFLAEKMPDFRKRHHHVRISLLTFAPFLAYGLIQAAGGAAIFRGGIGSIAAFATMDQWQQLLAYVLLFVAFYGFFKTRARVRLAIACLAVQLAALAIVGYYHSVVEPHKMKSLYGVIDMSGRMSYYSSFFNPNHFGGYVTFLQPAFLGSVAYYWMSRERGVRVDLEFVEKVFLLLMTPLIIASCVAADARTAFFWELVVMALVFLGLLLRRPSTYLILIAALVVALFVMLQMPSLHLERLSKDLSGRVQIMRESAHMLKDYFWFGAGLGTSAYILAFYQKMQPENWVLWQPYNNLLQLASEAGVVGAALFLVPITRFAGMAFVKSVQSLSRWNRVLGLCAFVALFSYLLPAMVDNYLAVPVIATVAVFYAAVLARCANGSYNVLDAKPDPEERLGFGRAALSHWERLAAVAVLWVAFSAFFFQQMRDYSARAAMSAASKNLESLERATKIRPGDANAWVELGHWRYNEGLRLQQAGGDFKPAFEQAIRCFRKAASLAPTWATVWTRLGKAEILAGQLEIGSRHLDFSVRLNPWNRDRLLYTIYVELELARYTKWPDEKLLFETRAFRWVEAASRLPRPLTPKDAIFLRNWPDQLDKVDQEYVSAFIERFYRIKNKLAPATSST